jgi:hypothetical protein
MKRQLIIKNNLLISQTEGEPDFCKAAIYPPLKAEIEKAIALVQNLENELNRLRNEGKLLTYNNQPTAIASDWLVRWSNSSDQMKALVHNPVIHTPTIAQYSWTCPDKPFFKQYLRNFRLKKIHEFMEIQSRKNWTYGKWRWCRHGDERDIRDYLYLDSPEPGGGSAFGQIRLQIPND